MNAYDTAAGTAQDDWLAGLLVTEEPKTVAPSVPQIPALPTPAPASSLAVNPNLDPASAPATAPEAASPPPPVPPQIPSTPPVVPASVEVPPPPPVPPAAPAAPAASENWLAMVMPEAAGHGMRTPINAGPSWKERLKLHERSQQIRSMLAVMSQRMLPLFRRDFLLPFVLGAVTMYAGETTVRYFLPLNTPDPVPSVDPKPNPPVRPDQQFVVPPKPVTPPVTPPVKPDNSIANNTNNNTPTPPVKPDTSTQANTTPIPSPTVDPLKPTDRPSPLDNLFPPTSPTILPTASNFDWILHPETALPPNRPAINPQNPWSMPNDLQDLFHPKPNQ